MITCPSCKNQLLEGSFFCPECGSQLVPVDRLATQSIRRETTDHLYASPGNAYPQDEEEQESLQSREVIITLNLIESGQVIRLRGLSQYLVGRFADGMVPGPEVDLAAYDGLAQGVSRQHALIKVSGPRVYIVDMGSANGTRVNGQKINPRVDFPLNHGDMIALGKFKIQFLVRK